MKATSYLVLERLGQESGTKTSKVVFNHVLGALSRLTMSGNLFVCLISLSASHKAIEK